MAFSIRIGQGIDVHRYATGDHVVLGGVRIPHTQGVDAHSDGDVLLHALCDALLGALALGDIGQHFPPHDPQWQGADSRVLLRRVHAQVLAQGWQPVNCDLTVVCERPKVMPYALAMRTNIASDLGIPLDAVSVKATTAERMGFTGRGEGLAALAVVLLQSG